MIQIETTWREKLAVVWGHVTVAGRWISDLHEYVVEAIAIYPTVTLWLGLSLIVAALIVF